MNRRSTAWVWGIVLGLGVAGVAGSASARQEAGSAPLRGWLQWRGPQQDGTSLETQLPAKWERGGTADLWSIPLAGRGTPVIAGERVYAWGYRGEGSELREVLACLEAGTGKILWEHEFADYLSDIVYDRYAIGAPSVDAQTGHVYLLTTPGDLVCFTADGKLIWEHPMMEQFGRLTFPNGRTGAVAIDGELAIVHCVTANWGAEGPPRDRFYAFDKRSGALVWSSDPGVGSPFLKDNSFSPPLFVTQPDGRRVFYCALGDGNVVCVDARTGRPIWRYQLAVGGINAAPLLHEGKIITVHDVENVDVPKGGGMFAIRVDAPGEKDEQGKIKLGPEALAWRNAEIASFSSSPVLVDGRVYQVDKTGVLYCVDAEAGNILWKKKLGTDQVHASPLYGDGKLYVPMNQGLFYILRLHGDQEPTELSKVQLEGNCLGAPAAWDGRVYVFTTERLYCFGREGGNSANLPKPPADSQAGRPGKPVALQVLPAEVLMRPGEKQTFRVRSIDALGRVVDSDISAVSWEKFVPPTARVRAEMDGEFEDGVLVTAGDARASAGAYRATVDGISGTIRGRILPRLPYSEDFDDYELTEEQTAESVKFAYPPLPWIGARFKWEVRELQGQKVLAKTTDNLVLQRAISFIGHPDEKGYTIQADVMSDGNRRGMGEVGVIVQRYLVILKGAQGQIEVSSNYERLRRLAPLKIEPQTWYTLKARVDVQPDGKGVVRVKAWPRDESEPQAWTMEVEHARAHRQGSPGLFGFSSTPKFRVYIDNVQITPNEGE